MPLASWRHGLYPVKNPVKYIGKKPPIYKSSWELRFMKYIDDTPQIIQWAYEPMAIPYEAPNGTRHRYYPDFLVVKKTESDGIPISYIVEIKPAKQTGKYGGSRRKNSIDRQSENNIIRLNNSKWKAADEYCRLKGMRFVVLTEATLLS